MNNLCFVLCILLLASCGNKSRVKRVYTEYPESNQMKLDSVLFKGVSDLLAPGFHLEFPGIPLNESCIIIHFMIDPENSVSDSIVTINYHIFTRYDTKAYKGMLNVDGYNIAIFDSGNFGDKYYNADSLKQIPLDAFKPYPMKFVFTVMHFVYKGKLNYWNHKQD